jgi:hypothetical protein
MKALYSSIVLAISNAEQKELQKFATPRTHLINQFRVSETEYNELRRFSNETSLSYHLDYEPKAGQEHKPNPIFVNIPKVLKSADQDLLTVTGKYLIEIAEFEKAEATIELQGLDDNFSEFLIQISVKHGEPLPEVVDMSRALDEGDRNNLLTTGTILNMYYGYGKKFFPTTTDVYQTEVTLLASESDPAVSIVITHVGVKSDE